MIFNCSCNLFKLNSLLNNQFLCSIILSPKSIFAYDPKSRGAKDYMKLVKSVINDEVKEETSSIESSAKASAIAS